jgi:serine/threonine-protein kinase
MSPERLKNNDYGGQSDIYSLGILMYEMLVGFPPFDSNTMSVAEVIVKHLMDEPEELRQIDPNIPIGVEKMVLQALAKDTSNRPSAIEFLNMAKKERWLLKQP